MTGAGRSRSIRQPGELDVDELLEVYAKAPEVYRDLMSRRDKLHRLEWAETIAQVVGNISGLVALGMCAIVAWHAFDSGAKAEGAGIICTGAVSIVGVFVTGRFIEMRAHGRRGRDTSLGNSVVAGEVEPRSV